MTGSYDSNRLRPGDGQGRQRLERYHASREARIRQRIEYFHLERTREEIARLIGVPLEDVLAEVSA